MLYLIGAKNMDDKFKIITDDNSIIINTYNQIAKDYFKLRESLILLDEINYLVAHTPENGKILDAGCGNGRDADIFSKANKQVVAVDFSEGQLSIARQRLNSNRSVNIIFDDIRNLNFPDNLFDGIWCCAVLPHFNDVTIQKILIDFHRFIKPNGIAIISFKKGESEKMVNEIEFNGITRYTNFHNESQITNFIKDAGFTLCSITDYNEQNRFGKNHRDIDFFIATVTKKLN